MIASIDLMGGKAVGLLNGKEKIFEADALKLARRFSKLFRLAVIDIDAAMGNGNNDALIKEILKFADCRVGGGIRSVERAKELLAYGAEKVIVGSKAFEEDTINKAFLKNLRDTVGRESVIIAIDCKDGIIQTEGWKHSTDLKLTEALHTLEEYCSEFLFTDISKDGTLEGANIDELRDLLKKTGNAITVAGGVRSIEELKGINVLGADAQVGMALYNGDIDLKEAFIETLNWGSELIPTVVQDIRGQVLMLAYSNKESLERTLSSEEMWYFSRSRGKLWKKGESSGNTQRLLKLRADCDSDTLLAVVEQKGNACHLGSYSCFGAKNFTIKDLYNTVKDRIENPREGSYTATLDDTKVREKLLEEAGEIVEAKTKEDIIWEAADVIYFLTVLLAREDVTIDGVLFELRRRRR